MVTTRHLLRALLFGALLVLSARAADSKKSYDLPATAADQALKRFSEISGRETLFAAEAVRGVRTAAVKGEFTPKEALDKMLDGTGLVAVQDEKTGALAVRRDPDPNAQRVAQTDSDRPTSQSRVENGKLVLDKYEVIGHHVDGLINKGLLQAGANAPVYHNVISREDIERLGVTSIQELFRYIPQTSSAATSLQSAVGSFGIGTRYSTTSLRGFSASQTVILVNGRPLPRTREVDTGGADLDRIPLAAIERVEILPLAGSAIYGAGAIGGAINIILRKDYSGRDLTTYIGTSTDGGATEYRFTYVDGRNFNHGKTNLTLTLSYQHRDPLYASQRDYLNDLLTRYGPNTTSRNLAGVSAFEQFTLPAFAGAPGTFVIQATPSAAINDLGIPGAPGVRYAMVPGGTTAAQSTALTPDSFTGTAGKFTPNERYGRMLLYEPIDSYSINAQIEHKFIPEKLESYAEFTLGHNQRKYSFPELASVALSATDPLNPFRTGVTPGFVGRAVTYLFDNPDIPDAQAVYKTDAARAVLGLRGKINEKWEWSVDGTIDYTHTTSWVKTPIGSNGLLVLERLSPAASATARRAVYNLLADHSIAGNQISAADDAKYFGYASFIGNKSMQYEGNARLSGDVFELPAGALRTSVTGKYRSFDLVSGQSGVGTDAFQLLVNGAVTPDAVVNPIDSKRHTWQEAVEAVVPVISRKWRPIPVESLDLNLSASAETNGTTGLNQSSQQNFDFAAKTGTTYVAAAKLQVTPDIAFRVSYSEGYYPPDWADVSDLVVTQNVPFGVIPDPKRGNTVQTPPWVIVNGGNPNLRPESATSTNYGLLFTPRFLPGLSLTVDYWKTRKTDAIVRLSFPGIIMNSDAFPNNIVRDAPTPADLALGWSGVITQVTSGPINVAELQTDGFDVQAKYDLPVTGLGRFIFNSNASFTNHFQTRALSTSPLAETAGAGGPLRWRGYGSVTWLKDRFGVTLTGRYVGHYSTATTSATPAFPTATGQDGGRIPAYLHEDLQFTYEMPYDPNARSWRNWVSGTKWTLGALNVLDEKPAFVSDAAAYNRQDDPRQRFIYLSVKKSF